MVTGSKLPIRVLQFGSGNFLRCFVDWMIDIMNKQGIFNGSIIIVQSTRHGKADILNEQNGKYNVYLRGLEDGKAFNERYLIDSIAEAVDSNLHWDRLSTAVTNPDLRFIVSNTTEVGIREDPTDSIEFKPPISFPGKLTKLLYDRFKFFNGVPERGFIIFPCELIDQNGEKLKQIVLSLADRWKLGGDFENWVRNANHFCNTLVDRIVPGFPVGRAAQIFQEIGYEDRLVSEGEIFHLWVIQAPPWIAKEFPAPEAGLNVQYVDEITPFRDRKVRILNGSHTLMTPVSYLFGIDTVKETIDHPLLGDFVQKAVYEEIIPNLEMGQPELISFAESVFFRFRNPYISHQLLNISLNSISKFETRVLPSLLCHAERTKSVPKRIAFSLACLLLFHKGVRNGVPFELRDEQYVLNYFSIGWNCVDRGEMTTEQFVVKTLSNHGLWKRDLTEIPELTEVVVYYLGSIEKIGIGPTLAQIG